MRSSFWSSFKFTSATAEGCSPRCAASVAAHISVFMPTLSTPKAFFPPFCKMWVYWPFIKSLVWYQTGTSLIIFQHVLTALTTLSKTTPRLRSLSGANLFSSIEWRKVSCSGSTLPSGAYALGAYKKALWTAPFLLALKVPAVPALIPFSLQSAPLPWPSCLIGFPGHICPGHTDKSRGANSKKRYLPINFLRLVVKLFQFLKSFPQPFLRYGNPNRIFFGNPEK